MKLMNWLKRLFVSHKWVVIDGNVEVDSFGALSLWSIQKKLGPDYRFRKIKDAPPGGFCSCAIYVLEQRKPL